MADQRVPKRRTVKWKRYAAGGAVVFAAGLTVGLLAGSGPIGPSVGALAPDTFGMRPSGGFLKQDRLDRYEAVLGRPIRWYVAFADRGDSRAMRSSVFGQMKAADAVLPKLAEQLDLVMTVPLAFGRATAKTEEGRATIAENLRETASGAHDQDYRVVAQHLVDGGYGDAVIRLGHECTGAWYPWAAEADPELYVEAYRHVHQVMAEVSPAFRFEWNVARGDFETIGVAAYPGDDVVDIVGTDIYYRPAADDPPLTDETWARRYQQHLEVHRDFAIERGKPLAYSEWAVGGVEEPAFIGRMADWFRSLPPDGPGALAYQIYWNTGEDRFNLDNYPDNLEALIASFGPLTQTTDATDVPLDPAPTTGG